MHEGEWRSCEKQGQSVSNEKIKYHKIPKISPSMYKPQTGNVKNPPLNRPSKYKPPGGMYCTWKIALKVKQSNNSKFTSSYKARPISILKCRFCSVDKPLQKGL